MGREEGWREEQGGREGGEEKGDNVMMAESRVGVVSGRECLALRRERAGPARFIAMWSRSAHIRLCSSKAFMVW